MGKEKNQKNTIDDYIKKYNADPEYEAPKKEHAQNMIMERYDKVSTGHQNNFYVQKNGRNSYATMKKILGKEKMLRVKSNLAMMSLTQKVVSVLKHATGLPTDFSDPDSLTEKNLRWLEETTDMLDEQARALEDNSNMLDNYQLRILKDIQSSHNNYEKFLEQKSKYVSQLQEHNEKMHNARPYSDEYIECIKNSIIGSKLHYRASKNCIVNVKRRDLRHTELKEVNQMSSYAEDLSFHMTLLSTHTEVLGEHLANVFSTMSYITKYTKDTHGIDKKMKKTMDLVSSYKGLVRDIVSMNKYSAIDSTLDEGRMLYR